MVIVVIHWKIKPDEDSQKAFLAHWAESLNPSERSHLIGEYLSRPMSADEVGFECGTLGLEQSSAFVSYFNIGLWESVAEFKQQIIDPFVGAKPEPKSFEYELRQRLILDPLKWRRGKLDLPGEDHLA